MGCPQECNPPSKWKPRVAVNLFAYSENQKGQNLAVNFVRCGKLETVPSINGDMSMVVVFLTWRLARCLSKAGVALVSPHGTTLLAWLR